MDSAPTGQAPLAEPSGVPDIPTSVETPADVNMDMPTTEAPPSDAMDVAPTDVPPEPDNPADPIPT